MSQSVSKPKRPPGWHHDEDTKRRISESNQRTKAIGREEAGLPAIRRCTNCGYWQDRDEFVVKKRKLVSGGHSLHLSSWCRKCEGEKAEAWRERKRQEGTLAKHRKKSENKYRKKMRRPVYVHPASFLEWFDEYLFVRGLTENAFLKVHDKSDSWARSIYRWRTGESERANIHMLDEIAVAAGVPELLSLLYADQ